MTNAQPLKRAKDPPPLGALVSYGHGRQWSAMTQEPFSSEDKENTLPPWLQVQTTSGGAAQDKSADGACQRADDACQPATDARQPADDARQRADEGSTVLAPSPNPDPYPDRNPNPSPNPNPYPNPNQVSMAKPEDLPTLHDGDSDDGGDDDYEVGARHIAPKKRAPPPPSRSSERKKRAGPAITLEATGSLLQDVGNQAARDDAAMEAASSLEAGGEPARPPFALPRCVREVLGAEARDANFKKNAEAVKKLRELLQKHNYNLPPEEDAALDRRDADGNVSCTLIVNGFPVNGNHPWLDGSGGGLARPVQHVVNVPHLGATLAAWPPGTHSFGPGLLYARRSGNPSYPDPSTVVSQSR